MPIKTNLTAAAAALTLGFGGAAFAQDAAAPTAAPESAPQAAPETGESAGAGAATAESADWSDEKLDAFAAAAVEVGSIQQDAAAEIEAEQDQAAQAALVEEANAKMVEAIEASGDITVPEYVEIAEAAQTDTALRTRIEEKIVAAQTQ